MTDLLEAAERVKLAVEAAEADRYIKLTQDELDRIHTYQFSMPTSPQPGFVYKREYWRLPGEKRWWRGPNEASVRFAIGEHQQRQDGLHNLMSRRYGGRLLSFWMVYTCELDPNDITMVLHKPREAKVIG